MCSIITGLLRFAFSVLVQRQFSIGLAATVGVWAVRLRRGHSAVQAKAALAHGGWSWSTGRVVLDKVPCEPPLLVYNGRIAVPVSATCYL